MFNIANDYTRSSMSIINLQTCQVKTASFTNKVIVMYMYVKLYLPPANKFMQGRRMTSPSISAVEQSKNEYI